MSSDFTVARDGVTLAGQEAGDGPPVILLHGLTATRRYVVMGSRSLERSGHRVVTYDARGHGHSSPAPRSDGYGYDELVLDLGAVMDQRGIDRAVLAGASMGAHTLLGFALRHPERVAGMVVITPAFEGDESMSHARLERWDALAEGLRHGGVEGFVAAYGNPHVASERVANTVLTVIRQRLSAHDHPDALADALQSVPRSRPYRDLEALASLPSVPTVVVASSDDADPEHPYATGQAYARVIPGARLVSDEPGASPIAWQGSQLSNIIAEVVANAG